MSGGIKWSHIDLARRGYSPPPDHPHRRRRRRAGV